MAERQQVLLTWLLEETFEPDSLRPDSALSEAGGDDQTVIEIGPRLNFSTAWSTNAVSICRSCGLHQIKRIERSIRYRIHTTKPLSGHDRMLFADAVPSVENLP